MMIRRAGPEDIPELIRLRRRYCLVDGADWSRDAVRVAFEPLLRDDRHGVVMIADDAGASIGYVVITWGWSIEAGGREALLDEIYVDKPRLGTGTALVESAMETARMAGAARVFLETEASNAEGRDFWSARGFTVEDSTWLQRPC